MKQFCPIVANQSWTPNATHYQPLSALHSQLATKRGKRVLEVNGRDLTQMMTHMLAHIASLPLKGRWIAMIAPPSLALSEILKVHGIPPEHVLMVHPKDAADTLWTVERALQSGTCCAVLAWPDEISQRDIRRLQLAAGKNDTLSVLFTRNEGAKNLDMGYRVLAEQAEATPWHASALCSNKRFNASSSHTFH